jgi:hypothetical protein
VHEHFPGGAGLAAYRSNDATDLARALASLAERARWEALMQGVATLPVHDWAARAAHYARLLASA